MRLLPFALLLLLQVNFSIAQTKTLAVIGSSTSACLGFNSTPGDSMNVANCYINKLVNYYVRLGYTINLHNDAVSGNDVYQGMPTGSPPISVNSRSVAPDPNVNITHALSFNPDVIIVNYPTNDYQYMTVPDVMKYLRTIRKAATDAGRWLYITTSQPRNTGFDAASRLKLMEIKDSILKQFGHFAINFWDVVANPDGTINPTYAQSDGIHINYLGHNLFYQRVVARNIFAAVVPLRFVSFEIDCKEKDIRLKWTVDNEDSTTIYHLQRSKDASNFETIVEVHGVTVGGVQTYSFTDANPDRDFQFYRVEAIENGASFYSPTVKAKGKKNLITINKIYSSAGVTTLAIRSEEKQRILLTLISPMGNIMYAVPRLLEQGNNVVTLQHSTFAKGIYWARISKKSASLTTRSFLSD